MTDNLVSTISMRYVTEALIYLLDKGTVFKYNLKHVTKSWRAAEKLVEELRRSKLVYVDDISVQDKKLYRVILTELGRTVAMNLKHIETQRELYFMDPHNVMLLELYSSKTPAVSEIERRKYLFRKEQMRDSQHSLLRDLENMGLVEVKAEEGTSISRSLKIRVSDKGKEVAEHLLAIKRIIESGTEEM